MFSFELNNAREDSQFVNNKLNAKSPIVEIFSAIVTGQDLSKYGKKVDVVMDHIKSLGERGLNGDYSAKAEINSIIRYTLEPHLNNVIKLFSFVGTFRQIGYHEQPMMKTYKHESIRSNFQASQGDVPFGALTWREYPIGTKTISSGYAVNYREVASGNLDKVAEGMEQVQVDMRNKALLYVLVEMYNAIKEAKGVKYFAETAGIQKQAVDDTIGKIRRFGRPAIMGDYSVVSQLNELAGFKADPAGSQATHLSEAVMEEIRQTGLLSTYNGSPVVELPNQYDLNQLNAAGDNFKTILPEGLLFFVPQGAVSPLQIFQRGGLTSMTGNDIVTGTELTRFDMEIGCGVAEGREHEIGLISDTNFEIPSL
jgi:hypothetical protein